MKDRSPPPLDKHTLDQDNPILVSERLDAAMIDWPYFATARFNSFLELNIPW